MLTLVSTSNITIATKSINTANMLFRRLIISLLSWPSTMFICHCEAALSRRLPSM
jgi:hypothetical protein